MKRFFRTLLAFCLLTLPCAAWGATKYIDPTAGAGGTGTYASPWNEFADVTGLSSGDTVAIKFGTTIREQFTVPTAGITIRCYDGDGDLDCTGKTLPIISGADVVSGGWTNDTGQVYYATVTGQPYQIFQDDEWMNLAHEPDSTTSYTTDTAQVSRYLVGETADDMPYSNSQIAGADLVITPQVWMRTSYRIQSYSANVITLVNDGRSDEDSTNFNGLNKPYYISDKRLFLDSEKEWFWDSSTNRLYFYQEGGGSPSGTITVTKRQYCIYALNKDNLTIRDLSLRNAYNSGIFLDDCSNFAISNVDASNMGTQLYITDSFDSYEGAAIRLDGSSDRASEGGTITDCNLNYCLNFGIKARDYDNVTITDNIITQIGLMGYNEGIGAKGQPIGISAVFGDSSNWIIRNNQITYTGYGGTNCSYNVTIENNTFDYVVQNLDDQGAIYQGSNKQATIRYNNIDHVGTNPASGTKVGIYLDNDNSNSVVEGNTIRNAGYGIFSHGGTNHTIRNNVICDFWNYGIYVKRRSESPAVSSHIITGNILNSAQAISQHVVLYSSIAGENPLLWFGGAGAPDFDNNTYYPDGATYFREFVIGSINTSTNFAGWQAWGIDDSGSITDSPSCGEAPIPEPSGSCPSGTYSLVWWGDHPSGTNYACTNSGAGSLEMTVSGATIHADYGSSGYGALFDSDSENISVVVTSDHFSSSEYTIYVAVNPPTLPNNGSISWSFRIYKDANNEIRANIYSDGHVYFLHKGNGVSVSRSVTGILTAGAWNVLGFRGSVTGNIIGINVNGSTWTDDIDEDVVTAFSGGDSGTLYIGDDSGTYGDLPWWGDNFAIIKSYNAASPNWSGSEGDTTAPTIVAKGILIDGTCTTNPTITYNTAQTITICLELDEDVNTSDVNGISYNLDSGPEVTTDVGGYYWRKTEIVETSYLLVDFILMAGMRFTDPQLTQMTGGTIQDASGNSLDTTNSSGDLGTIVIAIPYDSTSPLEIATGNTYETLTAAKAAFTILDGDNFTLGTVTEPGALDLSGDDCTEANPCVITMSGDWTIPNGGLILGDWWTVNLEGNTLTVYKNYEWTIPNAGLTLEGDYIQVYDIDITGSTTITGAGASIEE